MLEATKQENGRTILTENGAPALVGLHLRPSTTAPGRIKAAFVAKDGGNVAAMPLALATACGCEKKPHGYSIEFKIECN